MNIEIPKISASVVLSIFLAGGILNLLQTQSAVPQLQKFARYIVDGFGRN